jgi:hypothetical protein
MPETDDLELARRHAPVALLRHDEPYGPMAPERFLADSRLVWRRAARDAPEIAARGAIVAARLSGGPAGGAGPYRSPDGHHAAGEFTRPFDGGSPRGGLAPEQGFGIANRAVTPGPAGTQAELEAMVAEAPSFFEVERRASGETFVCYWLFYGSSTFPLGFASPSEWLGWLRGRIDDDDPDNLRERIAPALVASGDRLDAGDLGRLAHEHVVHQADWEGITVVLGKDGTPTHAFYRAHPSHARVAWTDLEVVDGARPLVLVGKGSHASYPGVTKLSRDYNDQLPSASRHVRWDTRAGLRPVREEPWYGFGGAWGDPDLDDSWFRVDLPAASSEFTGPLGPSGYKALAPG